MASKSKSLLISTSCVSIDKKSDEGKYTPHDIEIRSRYIWGRPVIRRMTEFQTGAAVLIFASQLYILAAYGNPVFDDVVGLGIWLPLLYIVTMLVGIRTHLNPNYWRFSCCLVMQGLSLYSSITMTIYSITSMGYEESMLQEFDYDKNIALSGIWVPWTTIMGFNMYITVSSFILLLVTLHDMYVFKPAPRQTNNIYPKSINPATFNIFQHPRHQVIRQMEDDFEFV